MIPEAAVEAAAEVLWETEATSGDIRAALEAAAPHMLAEAQADAWDEGLSSGVGYEEGNYYPTNPYR